MTALPNPAGVAPVPDAASVAGSPVPFAQHGRPSADRAARSFKPRGRMTPRLRRALELLAPPIQVSTSTDLLDIGTIFGRTAPLVVDLGFGTGETTVALAQAQPSSNVIGIDVHLPGIAQVAETASLLGLSNIRLVAADGIDVLRYMIPPGSVSLLQVAFPDPWPKPSQRHRRLVDARFVALAASRLMDGGRLHLATDVDDYALQMRDALEAEVLLRNEHAGFAPRDPARPVTKFERRALAAGRAIHELAYRRVAGVQRDGSNTAGST